MHAKNLTDYSFIHLLLRTRQRITSTKHTKRLKTYTVNTGNTILKYDYAVTVSAK